MSCQMVYHNGNCLNTKKPFVRACRQCIESCPHKALTDYHELDTTLCTECGACMAICPSDGFVDRTMDKLYEYLSNDKEIILNCPQAIPAGFEIPCLGMLDRDSWITLMLFAQEKSVTISTGLCAVCEDRQACTASVQVFKQIHAEWPEHPPLHIQVRPDEGTVGSDPSVKGLGSDPTVPTGPKTSWRQKGWEKVETWLPNLAAVETYTIPKSRQWCIETMSQRLEEKIPFQALTVADTCTSCGVCVSICPQGALQKREYMDPAPADPTKEDKILSMRLILEPQKCVQCRRCVEICRPEALSFSIKSMPYRLLTGKILIHEGSPLYCERCGKQVFDNTKLCLACSTSDPVKRGFFYE